MRQRPVSVRFFKHTDLCTTKCETIAINRTFASFGVNALFIPKVSKIDLLGLQTSQFSPVLDDKSFSFPVVYLFIML